MASIGSSRMITGAKAPLTKPSFVPTRLVAKNTSPLLPFRPQLPKIVPRSTGGSGGSGNKGGSGGRGGGGGGGGGGDGGKDDEDDESKKQPASGGIFQGWAERVAYDPEFPLKVLMEQIIGVGASVIGDMSSRPNWGLNELDFVFSTLIVGSILNFSIMYLLAPTAVAAGATGGNIFARILSAEFLRAWGAPGGNMFEPGAYSAGKRLLNFAYKGSTFAVIGFCAGIFGTAVSNGLLLLRKQFDPNFKLQNEPPHIIHNAACWGLHMGISANLRYQVLGGIDAVLVKAMPIALFRVYQAGIRAANNVAGGITFVTLARVLGVQKANEGAAPEPVPAPAAAGKKGTKKK